MEKIWGVSCAQLAARVCGHSLQKKDTEIGEGAYLEFVHPTY